MAKTFIASKSWLHRLAGTFSAIKISQNDQEFVYLEKNKLMTENLSIQYVTDQQGKKKAVLIPISDWNKILSEFQQMKEAQSLKAKLSSGFEQMEKIKAGKLPKTSLTQFIDEG